MSIIMLIFLMTAVTYLPRLLPMLFLAERPLPPFWRRFLTFIPFAALGALIIPGVFQAVPGRPVPVLCGIGAAIVSAWCKRGMILSVLLAIAVTYLTIRVGI
jgi:branched-subunit amino acid transport protein